MARPEVVVKLGGALLHEPELHRRVVHLLSACPGLVIVPGGGPFADVVRQLDARLELGDDLAHWLAVHAMDLHAELIVHRMPGARLAATREDFARVVASETPVVVAPYEWLRHEDPLPHSWEVTSDSVAAWVALTLGVRRLLLIKRVDGPLEAVADPYLGRLQSAELDIAVCTPATLPRALQEATRQAGHA